MYLLLVRAFCIHLDNLRTISHDKDVNFLTLNNILRLETVHFLHRSHFNFKYMPKFVLAENIYFKIFLRADFFGKKLNVTFV